MTKFSDIKFDAKDIVKLIGFLGFVGAMWFDLKTDQIKATEKMNFLQYQIDELKPEGVSEFIKPEQIKLKKTFKWKQ